MMRRSTFQTTLTGKLYAPKPVHDESKAANQSLYCQFVDAYCRFDDWPPATSVREAQTEWRKIREDEGAVRKRIEQFASRASSATAKLGDWAVTVSKAAPQPTGDGEPPSSDRDKPPGDSSTSRQPSQTPAQPESSVSISSVAGWTVETSRIVQSFLRSINVEPEKLLTPDVLQQSFFLVLLRNMSEVWHRFITAEEEYKALGQRREWKKSTLKQSVSATHDLIKSIGQ